MGVSKTSEDIQNTVKIPNPSQEPPASSKAPNQYFKDMDVLCTFKINIGSQNFQHGSNRNQWLYPNQDQDTKPKEGPNQDFKDMVVLCIFKIKVESQNLEQGTIKDPDYL